MTVDKTAVAAATRTAPAKKSRVVGMTLRLLPALASPIPGDKNRHRFVKNRRRLKRFAAF
jgi:hypothetical protein